MSTTLFDLTGKAAIVTGAGRGLGRAMAIGLAQAGARVAVAARTRPEIDETAALIAKAGGEAIAVPCDATRRADVQRLVAAAVERFGGLDVMVVDHGIGYAEKAEEITDAELDRMLAINLRGAIVCAQEAGKRMIAQRRGKIVNVSSQAGVVTFSVRQPASSQRTFGLPTSPSPGGCGAAGPKRVASRTPPHASAGSGGRKRRSPVGGAA